MEFYKYSISSIKACASLPGSPGKFSITRQFNWNLTGHPFILPHAYNNPQRMDSQPYPNVHGGYMPGQMVDYQQISDNRPLVLPCLENVDLPYADDSTLNTPSADHLCNFQNSYNFTAFKQRFTAPPPRFGILKFKTFWFELCKPERDFKKKFLPRCFFGGLTKGLFNNFLIVLSKRQLHLNSTSDDK